MVTPCTTVGNLLSEYVRVASDQHPYRFLGISNTVAYTVSKYNEKTMSTLKVKFGKRAKFYKVVSKKLSFKYKMHLKHEKNCIFSFDTTCKSWNHSTQICILVSRLIRQANQLLMC